MSDEPDDMTWKCAKALALKDHELDVMHAQLTAAHSEAERLREDKERLDFLEDELAREQNREYLERAAYHGGSLFRRNVPITRAAIDELRRTLAQEEDRDKESKDEE